MSKLHFAFQISTSMQDNIVSKMFGPTCGVAEEDNVIY